MINQDRLTSMEDYEAYAAHLSGYWGGRRVRQTAPTAPLAERAPAALSAAVGRLGHKLCLVGRALADIVPSGRRPAGSTRPGAAVAIQ